MLRMLSVLKCLDFESCVCDIEVGPTRVNEEGAECIGHVT